MCLARAASIIRNALFHDFPEFNGSFSKESKLSSVPESLLTFTQMILEGGSIDSSGSGDDVNKQRSLSLS